MAALGGAGRGGCGRGDVRGCAGPSAGASSNPPVKPVSHGLRIPRRRVIPSHVALPSLLFDFSPSLWGPLPRVSVGWISIFFFPLDDCKCRRWSGACAICINVVSKNVLCWGLEKRAPTPACRAAASRVTGWLGTVSQRMLLAAGKCSWEKYPVLRHVALGLTTPKRKYVYSLLQSACDLLLRSLDVELGFLIFPFSFSVSFSHF